MPSADFARIKDDVMAIAMAMPERRIMTFKAIGDYLDVMPRHIAYILATLPDVLAEVVPWHRVVPESGALGGSQHQRRRQLLIAEGFMLSERGNLINLQQLIIGPSEVASGVSPQTKSQGVMATSRAEDDFLRRNQAVQGDDVSGAARR
jgi:methylated-DNA-protein-cysteine methyltransferase related protein